MYVLFQPSLISSIISDVKSIKSDAAFLHSLGPFLFTLHIYSVIHFVILNIIHLGATVRLSRRDLELARVRKDGFPEYLVVEEQVVCAPLRRHPST